jgi:MCP family monocarboxylic acid transporter-like MFS transporter 10
MMSTPLSAQRAQGQHSKTLAAPPPDVPTSTPFPHLSPILSRLSLRHHSSRQPPPVEDGFDNVPGPLPTSDPVELERIITENREVRQQMRLDDGDVGPPPDGGKDAWACVSAAFFVLFCVFGWSE